MTDLSPRDFEAAMELGGVSRETVTDLHVYALELARWAKRINLIGPETVRDIWVRHIMDSLQLLPLASPSECWLDFGSGAGLPGMVVSCARARMGGGPVHLVESNQKKTAFLRAMKARLAPRTVIHDRRIEAVVRDMPAPDVISARAVASLDQLFAWIEPWCQGHTGGPLLLFPKGRGYEKEIRDSEGAWRYDHAVHKSRIEADSVILEIRNLRRL